MEPAALFASGLAAGLVAGSGSCTAIQGGLLTGLAGFSGLAGRKGGSGLPGLTRLNGQETSPQPPHVRGAVRADLAAVGAFLSGRLLSHVVVGVLLGAVGSAVQLGPSTRAVLLVAAGAATIVFAVRLLRRRPSGPCTATASAPASMGAAGRAGTAGLWHRMALGAATVGIPCGVTVSMEVIAVSSGSAAGGAAVMAGFVAGTAPAFAMLGLLLRRLAAARLSALPALAGIVALGAGIFTVSSGLRLGGWLPQLESPAAAFARVGADGTQRITVWATDQGFRPGITEVSANHPIEITFRTKDNRGCTRTVTLEDRDIVLPVSGQQIVRLPPRPPGLLRYSCAMGMYTGFVRVESTKR